MFVVTMTMLCCVVVQINVIGSNLSQQVYCFLTFVQVISSVIRTCKSCAPVSSSCSCSIILLYYM